jgi:hypothetical protein
MYYGGRACDPYILPVLNEISAKQAAPTTKTIKRTNILMNYLHTYPNSIIRYYVSDMVFKITSGAAYFVQPKAHSRAAAPFHLGWLQSTHNNGAVNILCEPIKNVVSSAVKAETGAIYMGGKHACPM